eukprot:1595336-Pyramimonas_sp.AAC.1
MDECSFEPPEHGEHGAVDSEEVSAPLTGSQRRQHCCSTPAPEARAHPVERAVQRRGVCCCRPP